MIQDVTPGLEQRLAQGPVTGYIGFDPTAPSLTLGNYVQVMLLKFFQMAGHKPVILMGGATGRIGDPSGKDTERELKSYEELDRNLAHQEKQMRSLLDFTSKDNSAVIVNNLDFYKDMNVLTYLREVGKNLTINYMLSKESVKRRIDTGMSYTEFSYQMLQAYDFLCLYRQRNCILQMGGSDQWGNITSGTEFIRRNEPGAEVHALTSPLLLKADGKKFGKSEEGNIWLDPEMTSPYKFYQFWLNVDDKDLPRLFRYFSYKGKDEIESLESTFSEEPNKLKVLLAEELTERIHGINSLKEAIHITDVFFGQLGSKEDLYNQPKKVFENLSWGASRMQDSIILNYNFHQDLSIIDFLINSNLFKSKSEARRAIEQGSVSINKSKILNIDFLISKSDLIHDKFIFLEIGKKKRHIVAFEYL